MGSVPGPPRDRGAGRATTPRAGVRDDRRRRTAGGATRSVAARQDLEDSGSFIGRRRLCPLELRPAEVDAVRLEGRERVQRLDAEVLAEAAELVALVWDIDWQVVRAVRPDDALLEPVRHAE